MRSKGRTSSLLAYPTMPTPLDEPTIALLFTPRLAEIDWVRSTARQTRSRVWQLALLKAFEFLGYFPEVDRVPLAALRHVAAVAEIEGDIPTRIAPRTLYRIHRRVRAFLGVSDWSANGQKIVTDAMDEAARVRAHPTELVNVGIDALIKARVELPALNRLQRIAGFVRERTERRDWARIHERLSSDTRERLDRLLVPEAQGEPSPFSALCTPSGRVTRDNAREVLEQARRIGALRDRREALTDIPKSKIAHWADEARRLTAAELRAYRMTRRRALLVCLVEQRQASLLDETVEFLVRAVRRLRYRADTALQERLAQQHGPTEALLSVFRRVLALHEEPMDSTSYHDRAATVFEQAGGVSALIDACDRRLEHRVSDWRAFVERPYRSWRSTLLDLLGALPLRADDRSSGVLAAVDFILAHRALRDRWIRCDLDLRWMDRRWLPRVRHGVQPDLYDRRGLEQAVVLGLVAQLRAGDLHVEGAERFGDYRELVRTDALSERDITNALLAGGLPPTADDFVDGLRAQLTMASRGLEDAVVKYECVRLNERGLPVVPPGAARRYPALRRRTGSAARQTTAGSRRPRGALQHRSLDRVDTTLRTTESTRTADR